MAKKEKKYLSFGGRLREQRKLLGLTQQQMADMAGITVQTQRMYEAGNNGPDVSYLHQISEAGADVGYIVNGPRSEPSITLPRFGTMMGYKFDNMGFAEVLMGAPEISRILEALADYHEETYGRDDLLKCLNRVYEYYFDTAPDMLAEVVMGAYRVKFDWIPRSD